MLKKIALLILVTSCASIFTTKYDLHLFYGGDKDYFQYDSMKKDKIVRFYTELLKNNLTFNVARQMQAKEIFRKVKMENFQKFENDSDLKAAVHLIKTFHLYHSNQNFEKELALLVDMDLSFQIGMLNQAFRKGIEKKGYWKKKYYLNILGRFSGAPMVHYKVFTNTFQELKEQKLITQEQLLKIGFKLKIKKMKQSRIMKDL